LAIIIINIQIYIWW